MSSILTVSQLNRYVGFKIKSDTKLHGVAVKGEISNLRANYSSGHIYFSLKDEEGIVKAVMFSANAGKIKFDLSEGMSVVAFGNVDVYERDGVYQLVVTDMQPIGIGVVKNSFDELKQKLEKMGVFDPSIKRNISKNPKKIAVVTSSSGAALQDIINVISRRCPVCKVKVFPTLVQGGDAPEMIAKALFRADRTEADTIILARGGGSAEDLGAFNTEKVVMAVYDCSTPVISAVGHQTDTTLTDYAADLRVPTPSAAAEIAVPDMWTTISNIDKYVSYIKLLTEKKISSCEKQVLGFDGKINAFSPKSRIDNDISKLDKAMRNVKNAFEQNFQRLDKALTINASKLSVLNPFSVMERGYSVVSKDDNAIKNSAEIFVGDRVNIRFLNGQAEAEIKKIVD